MLLATSGLGQSAVRAIEKAVPLSKVSLFAKNSGKLAGHKASTNPTKGQIPVVGSNGKLPASILPASTAGAGGGGTNGTNGSAGATGPAGPTGPTGATGAAGTPGAAGPSNAYSHFSDGPTALSNGSVTVTLSIPAAGSYVIFAKAYMLSTVNGDVSVLCELTAGGDFDKSGSSLDPPITGETLALNVVHTYSAAGTASLLCANLSGTPSSGQVSVAFAKITAIKVGSLVNS